MTLAPLVDIREAIIEVADRFRLVVPGFRMERGDIAIIIGPNGSGKSTLGRYICRIRGAEKVTAKRGVRPTPSAVMAWQSLNLFPLTVARNISIVRRENFEPALKYFSLWTLRGRNADSLSGGERQKLAIARSLGTRADLVVFDEPTSSLDGRTVERLVDVIGAYTGRDSTNEEQYIQEVVREVKEGSPNSVLVITHDLRFVRLLSRYSKVRLCSIAEDPERPYGQPHYVVNAGEGGAGYSMEHVHLHPPDLFAADFFGLTNVLGFTAAAGKPRGPEDFCSRYMKEAVGWIVLRDAAITVEEQDPPRVEAGKQLRGRVVGDEFLGPQKRYRILVAGLFGEYEITVPSRALHDAAASKDVGVSFQLEDNTGWSVISP